MINYLIIKNLSFPIDIQGTLDKQAPNMSPLNLWMTNLKAICLTSKLFAQRNMLKHTYI